MESNIEVSVCCACYNQERYIYDALSSIDKQITHFKFELLIFDDSSTDSTIKIIKNYKFENPNIIVKIVRNKSNIGVANNYFNMLNEAKGKYIAICEGDDFWIESRKLQKQYEIMEKDKYLSLVYNNVIYVDESNHIIGEYEFNEVSNSTKINVKSFEKIKGHFMPNVSSLFIRKKSIIPLPDWFIKYKSQDMLLIYIALFNGESYYIDEKLSAYRKALGSTIRSMYSNKQKLIEFLLNEIDAYNSLNILSNKKYNEVLMSQIKKDKIKLCLITNHFIKNIMFHRNELKQSFEYYGINQTLTLVLPKLYLFYLKYIKCILKRILHSNEKIT